MLDALRRTKSFGAKTDQARLDISEAKTVVKIPVLPLSFDYVLRPTPQRGSWDTQPQYRPDRNTLPDSSPSTAGGTPPRNKTPMRPQSR